MWGLRFAFRIDADENQRSWHGAGCAWGFPVAGCDGGKSIRVQHPEPNKTRAPSNEGSFFLSLRTAKVRPYIGPARPIRNPEACANSVFS